MIVFGIDVPLVEVLFAFSIIIFLILIEVIIVLALLIKKINMLKSMENKPSEPIKSGSIKR